MIDTRQFSAEGSDVGVPNPLFPKSGTAARSTPRASMLFGDENRPNDGLGLAPPVGSTPHPPYRRRSGSRSRTVTPWYRAKRVWVAALLLGMVLTARVSVAPDSGQLQSAVVPAQAPAD